MKRRKILFIIFILLTIAIDAFIIAESCIGGAGSSNQSQGFTQSLIEFISSINPNSDIKNHSDEVHAIVRKVIGHFLLFGLSGILSAITSLFIKDNNKHKWLLIIIVLSKGFLLACLTETIQFFIPGRAGMFTDILIDFSGYLLFSIIVFLIYYLIIKKKREKKSGE